MGDSEFLVGRDQELAIFEALLETKEREIKIINVHGTAGIGKSFLNQQFQRQAIMKGWRAIALDSHSFVQTPHAFCGHILNEMKTGMETAELEHEMESHIIIGRAIQSLNDCAEEDNIVLFIDTYEQIEGMDQWLREHFFKRIDDRILVVISGRNELSEHWFMSPMWRRLVQRMPLSYLPYAAVEDYLRRCGIAEQGAVHRIWQQSKGHPLTLSLAAFTKQSHEAELEIAATGIPMHMLPYIVTQWLREVPDEQLRSVVECAAVLGHFNQDILSFTLKRSVPTAEFHRLIRFSFVKPTERGWSVHDLMREAVTREIMLRTPKLYEEIRAQALLYYYEKVTAKNRLTMMSWEAVELLHYIGDSLVRAYMSWFAASPRRFEPADRQHRDELLAYVHQRQSEAKDTSLELLDPQTNRRFQFVLTAEQAQYTLKGFDPDRLFDMGYDVIKCLRDTKGNIQGLAVLIPINRKTLPYLLQNGRSAAFFGNLPPEKLELFAVPENTWSGWFINMLHMANFSDASISASVTHFMHGLMMTGELLIVSPPPMPYFTSTFESLGFQIAEHGVHCNYDGVTPTQTYVLDTRGDKLLSYIHGMLKRAGLYPIIRDAGGVEQPVPEPEAELDDLTVRQKEVAELLMQGLTNAQIASKLFLSEYTIKKHLKTLFQKYEVSTRTQLFKRMLEKK
ncbi:helix-turn-helix transcriptional regulator [Paenibacillus sedimenti]|uniref:Helix-turn-helix domain-containing protein n=1 Tax=Paenibacillus sedimenti TaxID=2770274 RepID=A0A926KVH3_9BACL|nr:LuxR family transcriptional regulator [Paenibacillus sedimenti]MBD0384795.1 helix-turn-helix domain-containing protein [Paenibacillus sedimenti]